MVKNVKKKREPLFHVTKKQDVSNTTKWISKIVAIGFGLVICAAVSALMGSGFSNFFVGSIDSCFVNLGPGSALSLSKIIDLVEQTGVLLLIALSLTLAFKMKFWNIGGEGQIIMGVLGAAIIQHYVGTLMINDAGVFANGFMQFIYYVLLFVAAAVFGALWGFIPAFFKARFKTNETLFTLMMNYIALLLVTVFRFIWEPKQGDVQPLAESLSLPTIGGERGWINIIIAFVLVTLIVCYMKFTKHGYEINVVGGSANTAKYIGINVKKVIIRTMIISGALCGVVGCLMFAGRHNVLSETIVNGTGFTGVMIAWVGNLGPIEIGIYSLLAAFINKGARGVNNNEAFPNIMLAVCFFVLIACEFFIHYEIRCEKLERFLQKKFPKHFKKEEASEVDEEIILPANAKKEGK